jgi:hypothetical protein
MAKNRTIASLGRGASALTAEAGKLIRDRALGAAHQALILAQETVRSADRSLRGATATAPRAKKATAKKTAKKAAKKAVATVATVAKKAKSAGAKVAKKAKKTVAKAKKTAKKTAKRATAKRGR